MGYSPLIGKLHTRYSPVRRSPAGIATPAAPRLACVKPVASVHPEPGSNSSLFKLFYVFAQDSVILFQVQVLLTVFILNTCTTVVYVIFSKNSFESFLFETWCKGKDFYSYLPNLFESFFDLFFWKSLSERLQDIRLDLPTSSLGVSLSGFLSPYFIMSPPHLSRLRVQKYCPITYNPNILDTFFYLFFALLDCQ